MDWYRLFNGVLIGPVIRRRVRVRVIGRKYLPLSGGCMFAMGSHTTEVESVIIPASLPERQFHFYAKVEYWRQSGLKGRLRRWFMDAIGDISVDRGDKRAALQAIEAGARLLWQGEVVAVYPEGTRSTDGKLHGAYPGTVYSVLQASYLEYRETGRVPNIPIIPVGLIGMERASSPKGGFWPRRCRVTIVIGPPIWLNTLERAAVKRGKINTQGTVIIPTQGFIAKEVGARMMHSIEDLCGKEYDPERLDIPGAN